MATSTRFLTRWLPATALALSSLSTTTASAAETGEFTIEEIIVTAQKRAESLQEVPIAISAFDERTLEEFSFDHIMDVAEFIPNLNISTPFAASNPFIALRGIGNGGDFNPNIDSGVAVHIDDVFLQAPAGRLGQMFDLERLEVLRGPQGTLYGKNTTGGSINMISRKPGDEFAANISLSAGDYGLTTIEAGMSFLGLGVRPPTPSWGSILNDGYTLIRNTPWLIVAGGIPLVVTTLGFTFLGEALRDVVDPTLRGQKAIR